MGDTAKARASGKNDELCVKNDESCIENDESCIENDGSCINNDDFRRVFQARADVQAQAARAELGQFLCTLKLKPVQAWEVRFAEVRTTMYHKITSK